MAEDRLIGDISWLFRQNGIFFRQEDCMGTSILRALRKGSPEWSQDFVTIIPIPLNATSAAAAAEQSSAIRKAMSIHPGAIAVAEDRWRKANSMISCRLLAHLGIFRGIFARDCEVRKISHTEADRFLNCHHSYGGAKSRYNYGIFLKRDRVRLNNMDSLPYPAHSLTCVPEDYHMPASAIKPGTIIAAAEFSNARRWVKSDREIRSYEWIRYASLPDVRINGGMGKVLKHFIEEVHPDDIMSYADLEWSDGQTYTQLGFIPEGEKSPVTFIIDKATWERTPLRKLSTNLSGSNGPATPLPAGITPDLSSERYFQNFGSMKYRLRLY